MGILRYFKGKQRQSDNEQRQSNNNTPTPSNDVRHDAQQNTDTADTETPRSPTPRRSTLIRRVSTNTMRKLRMIGQALRLIGDDMERRSLQGSNTDVHRGEREIMTRNNTDIDVAARNARNEDITKCKSHVAGSDQNNTEDRVGVESVSDDIDDADVSSDNKPSKNNRHSTEI